MGSKFSKHRRKHVVKLPKSGEREAMAVWIREGVAVTDVYDILDVVGHGHMGEISIVSRKQDVRVKSNREHVPLTVVVGDDSGGGVPAVRTTERTEVKHSTNDEETNENHSRRLYACKTVSTTRMKSGDKKELLNEVKIMRELDHPHILHLFEVYHVKRKMWLITELCTGGDLFTRIDSNTEDDIAVALEQICRAVAYMHRRGVCHRDIKLENILYEHDGGDSGIKLIDFGLSQKFTRGEKMLRAVGTMYTVAPELILGRGYTEKSDLWSIGVVAFVLLSGGDYPFLFESADLDDTVKRDRLLHAKYVFGPSWKERGVTKEAKEFVHSCIRKHPGLRWTANDAREFVQSKWISRLEAKEKSPETDNNDGANEKPEDPSIRLANCAISEANPALEERDGNETQLTTNLPAAAPESTSSTMVQQSTSRLVKRRRTRMPTLTLEGMKNFSHYGLMKKTILMTMAYTMDKTSLGRLSDLFLTLDTDGTGTISLAELRDAVRSMHADKTDVEFTEETIEYMFHGIDQDQSGQIHYAEFLAAIAESQGLITMERLAEAYDRIDSEGKGYISKEDLRDILGSDYNDELVDKMIDEVNHEKDGQVDYDEFLKLMFEDPAVGRDYISGDKGDWSVDSLSYGSERNVR